MDVYGRTERFSWVFDVYVYCKHCSFFLLDPKKKPYRRTSFVVVSCRFFLSSSLALLFTLLFSSFLFSRSRVLCLVSNTHTRVQTPTYTHTPHLISAGVDPGCHVRFCGYEMKW